jgi:hypothetical protein
MNHRKRIRFALFAAGICAAISLAPATAGAAGGGDSASGNVSQFGQTTVFSGRSSNVNTDARGRIRVTFTNSDPNAVYTAEVTCMRVIGATATTFAMAVLSGRIVDQPPGSSILSLQVHATDSGKMSNAPDGLFVLFSGAPSPTDGLCPDPLPFSNPVAEGQITIDNALP